MKNKKIYIDFREYQENTPERIATEFLFQWQMKNPSKMFALCQNSWKKGIKQNQEFFKKYKKQMKNGEKGIWFKPELFFLHEHLQRDIFHAKLTQCKENTAAFWILRFEIRSFLNDEFFDGMLTMNAIREKPDGRPTMENNKGKWGINPISALNIQSIN
jgi:hypothetical protein